MLDPTERGRQITISGGQKDVVIQQRTDTGISQFLSRSEGEDSSSTLSTPESPMRDACYFETTVGDMNMVLDGKDKAEMAVMDRDVDFHLTGLLSKHNDVRLTSDSLQAFENTSTNIAAAQMRNNLTNLAETVTDPEQKKASCGYTVGRRDRV